MYVSMKIRLAVEANFRYSPREFGGLSSIRRLASARLRTAMDRFNVKYAPFLLIGLLLQVAALGCGSLGVSMKNAEGVRFYEQGRYDQAALTFQEAAAMEPGDEEAKYNLATTYHKLSNIHESDAEQAIEYRQAAIDGYLACLAQDSNNAYARRGITVLMLEEGRIDEAERQLLDWSTAEPYSPEPEIQLARLYFETERYEQAMEQLVRANAIDNQNPRVYAAMGQIYELEGNSLQALYNYRRSLERKSQQPDLITRIRAIEAELASTSVPVDQQSPNESALAPEATLLVESGASSGETLSSDASTEPLLPEISAEPAPIVANLPRWTHAGSSGMGAHRY
jgi:tetratricopeptide (TPR) repeat protein